MPKSTKAAPRVAWADTYIPDPADPVADVPVSVIVNEDVYVSESKPYTFRLTIRTMKRLEAYCKRSRRGKGAVIDEAVEQWLAAQGDA